MKLSAPEIKISLVLLLATAPSARPQGTFVNLDFESAIIEPLSTDPHLIALSNALPGWTAYGNYAGDNILYDTVSLGAAAISIHDSGSVEPILQGNYTVYLQGSTSGLQIIPAIGQVGTVPSTARSITYLAAQASFTVTFAGQVIPVSPIGSGPNYTIFGGDISAFAGETGELKLQGGGLLDNISFSSQAIPEAGAAVLLLLGTLGLCLRRRK